MYPVEKIRKTSTTKGQKWPAIFLTPQDYSEIACSPTRTENLPEMLSLIVISISLLMKLNSLLSKNFSLLINLEFPVNFDAQITRTYESEVRMGLFTHAHS